MDKLEAHNQKEICLAAKTNLKSVVSDKSVTFVIGAPKWSSNAYETDVTLSIKHLITKAYLGTKKSPPSDTRYSRIYF